MAYYCAVCRLRPSRDRVGCWGRKGAEGHLLPHQHHLQVRRHGCGCLSICASMPFNWDGTLLGRPPAGHDLQGSHDRILDPRTGAVVQQGQVCSVFQLVAVVTVDFISTNSCYSTKFFILLGFPFSFTWGCTGPLVSLSPPFSLRLLSRCR